MTQPLSPCPLCGEAPAVYRRATDERTGYAVVVTIQCPSGHLDVTRTDSPNPNGGYALADTGMQKARAVWESIAALPRERALDLTLIMRAKDELEAECQRLREKNAALEAGAIAPEWVELLKHARATHSIGAQVGPHWLHLGVAITKAEALLRKKQR